MNTARRFATNTVEKPIDRRRVLGFGPGLRMNMNPRGSNLAGYSIPQGQLIIFNPRGDGYFKERMKSVANAKGEKIAAYDGHMEISGYDFARGVAAKFQGGVSDFGFRILECLNDLDYDVNTGYDEADAYFNLLHPRLTCEMELEQVTYGPAGDLLNQGEPLPCPTCRIEWLESAAAQEAIFGSSLDHIRLESLRQTLLTSYRAGRLHAQARFNKAKGEVDSPTGKIAFDDADYSFMKMLHKKPAHIEQAEIQSNSARIQGEAIGKSVADAFAAQNDLAEFRAWKAAKDAEPEESFGEKMAKAKAAKKEKENES